MTKSLQQENLITESEEKKWNETKIFILPLMPSDEDEKKVEYDFEYEFLFFKIKN